jgi:hypothetical protein
MKLENTLRLLTFDIIHDPIFTEGSVPLTTIALWAETNKKFWKELIVFFPLIRRRPYKKRRLQ